MGRFFPLSPRGRLILFRIVWVVALVVWTAGLVTPDPKQYTEGTLTQEEEFSIAKTTHVLAYAFLAYGISWLDLPGRTRWLPVAFLSLHAFGTEAVQWAFPELNRSGSLRNVGLDHVGIVLGLAVAWRYWLRRR